MPLRLKICHQARGDFLVAARRDLRQHFVTADLRTDFVEETGELQADVPAADNSDVFRNAGEPEEDARAPGSPSASRLGLRALARLPRRRDRDRREPVLLRDRRLRPVRALLVPADLHVPARRPDAAGRARQTTTGSPATCCRCRSSAPASPSTTCWSRTASSAEPGLLISAPGGCATKWIDEFGYVTIPTLALTAFVLVFAFSPARAPSSRGYPRSAMRAGRRQSKRRRAPRRRPCGRRRRAGGFAEGPHRSGAASSLSSSSRSCSASC